MVHGHEVDPPKLIKAAHDIVDAIPQVERANLESVSGNREWYGHDAVFNALTRFCTTWQLATQVLAARAGSAGHLLQGAAQVYARDDEQAASSIQGQITGIAQPGQG